MKFKYYLRGAGVGMIVTTLIFTIALLRYKPTLSADEIREQAAKLGMVMQEETSSGDAGQVDQQNRKDDIEDSDSESEGKAEPDVEPGGKEDSDVETGTEAESGKSGSEGKNTSAETTKEEPVTVRFVIKGGQFSDVVSNNLAEKGLVPDGEEYNKWLMSHHYDSDILPGVYYIKSDATYKEIAEIITTEQE